MKLLLTAAFVFLSIFANAQATKALDEYFGSRPIKEGQAAIYGNFIQRLGFSSGGLQQQIVIANTETGELFSFVVKPQMKSAKENTFCFLLPAGSYQIANYLYNQSTWYGAKMFSQPILKNLIANEELQNKPRSGELSKTDLARFTFTVEPNTLNYLGSWHFDQELVSFSDDKATIDKKMAKKNKRIDFDKAKTLLPN